MVILENVVVCFLCVLLHVLDSVWLPYNNLKNASVSLLNGYYYRIDMCSYGFQIVGLVIG